MAMKITAALSAAVVLSTLLMYSACRPSKVQNKESPENVERYLDRIGSAAMLITVDGEPQFEFGDIS